MIHEAVAFYRQMFEGSFIKEDAKRTWIGEKANENDSARRVDVLLNLLSIMIKWQS